MGGVPLNGSFKGICKGYYMGLGFRGLNNYFGSS